MFESLIAIVICFSALLITIVIEKYALRYSVLDLPNHRSLHENPTPRGGGLSIVLLVVVCLLTLYYVDLINLDTLLILFIPLCITAFIAYIDDHKPIPILIRALFYFVAAGVFFYLAQPGLSGVVVFLLIVSIVWMINLFNFMDGVDGLAAVETITTAGFAMLLFYKLQIDSLFWLSLVIVFASIGFLIRNWAPARIFLGDVGSCTLGLLLSMIAIISYLEYNISLAVWLVLLSVFIADASFTLLKRFLNRDKWYRAHKEHAYQRLVMSGYSHARVSKYVLCINIILLWPAAYWVYLHPEHSIIVVFLNYGILAILWFKIQTISSAKERNVY